MVTRQGIEEAVQRLVGVAHSPLKVILFGSRADGRARDDSDVDLLVVEEDIPDMPAEYRRLRAAVGSIGAGVDLLLYPRQEFERRMSWTTSPVREAVAHGHVLFDVTSP
jgi:predicted nucleotidyltransferase